jgi:single-stranded DNA-binding protein
MIVEFPNLGTDNKPAVLKVVAWRDLAQQVSQQYHEGDLIIIEGRLGMNTIERPEGFKEKRAELTVSKIYPVGPEAMSQDENQTSTTSTNRASGGVAQQQPPDHSYNNVVDLESRRGSTVKQESKPNQPQEQLPPDDSDPIPF